MNAERRFYIESLDATELVLGRSESHHLTRVLRLHPDDEVVLFDGKGAAVRARIVRTSDTDVRLARLGPAPSLESPLTLRIALAMLKQDKMTYAVQKLTELGVSAITPVVSEHVEARFRESFPIERWQRISLAAAKQCRRSRLPELESPRPLEQLLDESRGRLALLDPSAPPLQAGLTPASELTLVIGPEGGWSADERRHLRAQEVETFSLGPRVLRSETAAVAAATLAQWLFGDWGTGASR